MRTPDEQAGFRFAAWAGALLAMLPAALAGWVGAAATFVEVTSESVSADYQLADAAPAMLLVPLLLVVTLGGLLQRWGAGWLERAAVVPLFLVLPYLLLAWYVASLWAPTDLGLIGDGEPPWSALLATVSFRLLLLGVAALAIGTLAGRLGAAPTSLALLVLAPTFALTFLPPWYGRLDPAPWESPVWFSLRVLVDGEDQLVPYGACPVLAAGLCGRAVDPLLASVHVLVLLALLAAVAVGASAATRALRRPRRRLTP